MNVDTNKKLGAKFYLNIIKNPWSIKKLLLKYAKLRKTMTGKSVRKGTKLQTNQNLLQKI